VFKCDRCKTSKIGPRHLLMDLSDWLAQFFGTLAWRLDKWQSGTK
jgi:hypothetical protein